ncbi:MULTISPECIES: DUF2570 domain-containing protein [Brenneria]|uniref:DUF2570 domain-containing protein n=1 Tax=Brenneria nigrifluens DSM 30175 = ATCC 13028 TaxID=1121120 RepID=A0A2U1UQD1_9GAMM|nr:MULTISPECIES: DUF2570 domain-containing protein [Brenneria]EHD23639.1 putative exported protein [Brenneria sp. EniD312]PWC23895.1 DUF2570 domain-containing protein [Brenneria nigrifluens DSM 30175 = ATCC 13028]QCR06566.1 DUF2570 domain-containing protein [Brenneria nigrifluens DSM 30175 = ATCC 13028]
MKLTIVLSALLALVSAGLLWQTYQRGTSSAKNEALSVSARQQNAVLEEIRAMGADAREALAAIRANEQKRNAEGENRREKMRSATQGDTCANTVVPAAVSDGLQKHAPAAGGKDSGRADAGKSDGTDAPAGAAIAGNVGRDSNLE